MPSTVQILWFIVWILLDEIFLLLWQICGWPIIDCWLFWRHRNVLTLRGSKWCSALFVSLLHRILVLVLERCWVLLFKIGLSFETLTYVVLLKVQLLWEHVEVINLVTRLNKCGVHLHKRGRHILHKKLAFLWLWRLEDILDIHLGILIIRLYADLGTHLLRRSKRDWCSWHFDWLVFPICLRFSDVH